VEEVYENFGITLTKYDFHLHRNLCGVGIIYPNEAIGEKMYAIFDI
jgi:hypothetical protein